MPQRDNQRTSPGKRVDYLIWNVDPEIFRLGRIAPHWYGLFFALGFFAGYFILLKIYRNERRREENLSDLFLYIFLGTLIGARLGHVLFYQPDYYLVRPWEILMIWQGGLASHGGFTGVLIALYFYCKKYTDMSFLELSDRLAMAALPAASLIRVGTSSTRKFLVFRQIFRGRLYSSGSILFHRIRRCSMNRYHTCLSFPQFTLRIGRQAS